MAFMCQNDRDFSYINRGLGTFDIGELTEFTHADLSVFSCRRDIF